MIAAAPKPITIGTVVESDALRDCMNCNATRNDIRGFQFQISIFIIIWVLGGIAYILQNSRTIVVPPLQSEVGLEINAVRGLFKHYDMA